MTAHKHAHLILQYAQDALETDKPWERWELRPMGREQWHACSSRITFSERFEYRRKPHTMTYTVTIPEPLREAPGIDTKYFFPDLGYFERFCEVTWDENSHDHYRLRSGLCFATAEDAIAAAKAMMPIREEV